MGISRDDDAERCARMEQLVEKLTAELDSLREVRRAIADTMAEDSRRKAARSKAAQRFAADARDRAVARAAGTRKLTRRKVR